MARSGGSASHNRPPLRSKPPRDRRLCVVSFQPESNRNLVGVGPTRTGKTVVARALLADRKNVLLVDPKHEWKPRPQYGDRVAKNLRELGKQLNRSRDDGRRVIYKPPKEHLLPGNSQYLDEVAYMALSRKNTLLFYDELVFVANGSDFTRRAPNFYFCLTTGNGLGVGVWGLCQRPTHIPLIVLTESTYRYTFYLRKQSDRDRMEELLGEDIPWEVLRRNRYSFVFGDDMDTSAPTRLNLTNSVPRVAAA